MEEHQKLLTQRESNLNDDSSSEDWEGSTSGSYYSDSDSSVPEWESLINESTGELLYIDCHPFVTQNVREEKREIGLRKSQARQSTRSKFLRLIRKRESKRHQSSSEIGAKVKFQDCQEGEEREVILRIKRDNLNISAEALLGLHLGTLSDGSRVMISGFANDSEARSDKNIKIGDWLKSINSIEVNNGNVENVLDKLKNEPQVVLKLQRVAGVDVTKIPPINVLNNQSKFVSNLINNSTENEHLLLEHSFGVVLLNIDSLSNNLTENSDVLYCFPRPAEKNILARSKGVYMTLNHLLPDITKQTPKVTSLSFKNATLHIAYNQVDLNKLLLIAAPSNHISREQLTLINCSIIRFLEFTYATIPCALESSNFRDQVDSFFCRYFSKFLDGSEQICDFEGVLPGAELVSLPREAQMQVDDALTELEASDYREWNEDPLNCQRLFTILGSAVYHNGYLLLSHLPHEDLIDINNYCDMQGLFHLTKQEPLKNLVLWREIFPVSCGRGKKPEENSLNIPDGRRYLLIIGSRKQLLAVIMEAGGCTEPPEENTPPDAFYVEEAEATLSHIQELGIPELADRCLSISQQSVISEIPTTKRKPNLLSAFTRSPTQNRESSASPIMKKSEVTSILKRRASDQMLSSSMFSLPDDGYDMQSEDSMSQGGVSEKSDEPVMGRRVLRERGGYQGSDNEESDDDCGDSSQLSSSSFDISELRQTLLSESEDIQSLQLTAGEENVLLHYVQFDTTEGIVLCPPENKLQPNSLRTVLDHFRKCCYSIRELFQNTIRFKNLPAQEMSKSLINKSVIAIKEHGICFECTIHDERSKKSVKLNFWVIGRLFYSPHPKELYVCYEDSIPQNIMEIAFRLGMNRQ